MQNELCYALFQGLESNLRNTGFTSNGRAVHPLHTNRQCVTAELHGAPTDMSIHRVTPSCKSQSFSLETTSKIIKSQDSAGTCREIRHKEKAVRIQKMLSFEMKTL